MKFHEVKSQRRENGIEITRRHFISCFLMIKRTREFCIHFLFETVEEKKAQKKAIFSPLLVLSATRFVYSELELFSTRELEREDGELNQMELTRLQPHSRLAEL